MNTTQLECFLAVADTLNYARAAERLHITQPAVSHQISSLENELNTRLFLRTTRNVELTPAGFHFLGDAQNILNLTHSARARLDSLSLEQISEFYIGCTDPLEQRLLPGVLHTLSLEFPLLHPVIRQAPFPIMLRQLKEESLHVVFGFDFARETNFPGKASYGKDSSGQTSSEQTSSGQASSGQEARPYRSRNTPRSTEAFSLLSRVPISCVLSPSHPLASRKSIRLEELGAENLLVSEPRRTAPAISAAITPLVGQRSPGQIYFSETPSAVLTLAKAGFGFSLMPDVPLLHDPELAYIPVDSLPPMDFGLFYKNLKTHPALKRFLALMKEEAASG